MKETYDAMKFNCWEKMELMIKAPQSESHPVEFKNIAMLILNK